MILPNNQLVDRYAVLLVKKEFGQDVDKELNEYGREYFKLDNSDLSFLLGQLYQVHKEMYPIHNYLMRFKLDGDITTLLFVFMAETQRLLRLNDKRSEIRSEIAKKFDEYEEYKDYDSEIKTQS